MVHRSGSACFSQSSSVSSADGRTAEDGTDGSVIREPEPDCLPLLDAGRLPNDEPALLFGGTLLDYDTATTVIVEEEQQQQEQEMVMKKNCLLLSSSATKVEGAKEPSEDAIPPDKTSAKKKKKPVVQKKKNVDEQPLSKLIEKVDDKSSALLMSDEVVAVEKKNKVVRRSVKKTTPKKEVERPASAKIPKKSNDNAKSKKAKAKVGAKKDKAEETMKSSKEVEEVSEEISVRCRLPLSKLRRILHKIRPMKKDDNSSSEPPDVVNPRSSSAGSDDKRFMCLYCDRSFVTSSLQFRHVQRVHKDNPSNRRSSGRGNSKESKEFAGCGFCFSDQTPPARSVNLKELFLHMSERHGDKYFACTKCSVRFPNSENLNLHLSEVHGQKAGLNNSSSIDFEKDIAVNIVSLVENKGNQSKVVITEAQSGRTKKLSQATSIGNNESMLSRLGVTQNRSPGGKKKGTNNRKSNDMKSPMVTDKKQNKSKSFTSQDPQEFVINKNINSKNELFDSRFDKDFYKNVTSNVCENLARYLDGKMNNIPGMRKNESVNNCSSLPFLQEESRLRIHESNASLTPISTFPTLLASEQYGATGLTSNLKLPRKKATKNSWKWKFDFVKKYKYYNENGKMVKKVKPSCLGTRDLSKLDMWTQLTMKSKYDLEKRKIEEDEERKEKVRLLNELNSILDTRLFPKLHLEQDHEEVKAVVVQVETETKTVRRKSSRINDICANLAKVSSKSETEIVVDECETKPDLTILEDTCFPPTIPLEITDESVLISDYLQLTARSGDEVQVRKSYSDVYLSGEWARPRCYVCVGCGKKLNTLKELEDHKTSEHAYIYSTYYEIIGKEMINSEVYRLFHLPGSQNTGKLLIEEKQKTEVVKKEANADALTECTKCQKELKGDDLYRHLLECAGDAWLLSKKKSRYRPFGSRSRRRRARLNGCKPSRRQNNNNPGAIVKKLRRKVKTKSSGPRTKPSDAETIQRMLANLPAKRLSKHIVPLPQGAKPQQKNQKTTNQKLRQQHPGNNIRSSRSRPFLMTSSKHHTWTELQRLKNAKRSSNVKKPTTSGGDVTKKTVKSKKKKEVVEDDNSVRSVDDDESSKESKPLSEVKKKTKKDVKKSEGESAKNEKVAKDDDSDSKSDDVPLALIKTDKTKSKPKKKKKVVKDMPKLEVISDELVSPTNKSIENCPILTPNFKEVSKTPESAGRKTKSQLNITPLLIDVSTDSEVKDTIVLKPKILSFGDDERKEKVIEALLEKKRVDIGCIGDAIKRIEVVVKKNEELVDKESKVVLDESIEKISGSIDCVTLSDTKESVIMPIKSTAEPELEIIGSSENIACSDTAVLPSNLEVLPEEKTSENIAFSTDLVKSTTETLASSTDLVKSEKIIEATTSQPDILVTPAKTLMTTSKSCSSIESTPSKTPSKRRSKKLTDCIAMLTNKLNSKLSESFSSPCNIFNSFQGNASENLTSTPLKSLNDESLDSKIPQKDSYSSLHQPKPVDLVIPSFPDLPKLMPDKDSSLVIPEPVIQDPINLSLVDLQPGSALDFPLNLLNDNPTTELPIEFPKDLEVSIVSSDGTRIVQKEGISSGADTIIRPVGLCDMNKRNVIDLDLDKLLNDKDFSSKTDMEKALDNSVCDKFDISEVLKESEHLNKFLLRDEHIPVKPEKFILKIPEFEFSPLKRRSSKKQPFISRSPKIKFKFKKETKKNQKNVKKNLTDLLSSSSPFEKIPDLTDESSFFDEQNDSSLANSFVDNLIRESVSQVSSNVAESLIEQICNDVEVVEQVKDLPLPVCVTPPPLVPLKPSKSPKIKIKLGKVGNKKINKKNLSQVFDDSGDVDDGKSEERVAEPILEVLTDLIEDALPNKPLEGEVGIGSIEETNGESGSNKIESVLTVDVASLEEVILERSQNELILPETDKSRSKTKSKIESLEEEIVSSKLQEELITTTSQDQILEEALPSKSLDEPVELGLKESPIKPRGSRGKGKGKQMEKNKIEFSSLSLEGTISPISQNASLDEPVSVNTEPEVIDTSAKSRSRSKGKSKQQPAKKDIELNSLPVEEMISLNRDDQIVEEKLMNLDEMPSIELGAEETPVKSKGKGRKNAKLCAEKNKTESTSLVLSKHKDELLLEVISDEKIDEIPLKEVAAEETPVKSEGKSKKNSKLCAETNKAESISLPLPKSEDELLLLEVISSKADEKSSADEEMLGNLDEVPLKVVAVEETHVKTKGKSRKTTKFYQDTSKTESTSLPLPKHKDELLVLEEILTKADEKSSVDKQMLTNQGEIPLKEVAAEEIPVKSKGKGRKNSKLCAEPNKIESTSLPLPTLKDELLLEIISDEEMLTNLDEIPLKELAAEETPVKSKGKGKKNAKLYPETNKTESTSLPLSKLEGELLKTDELSPPEANTELVSVENCEETSIKSRSRSKSKAKDEASGLNLEEIPLIDIPSNSNELLSIETVEEEQTPIKAKGGSKKKAKNKIEEDKSLDEESLSIENELETSPKLRFRSNNKGKLSEKNKIKTSEEIVSLKHQEELLVEAISTKPQEEVISIDAEEISIINSKRSRSKSKAKTNKIDVSSLLLEDTISPKRKEEVIPVDLEETSIESRFRSRNKSKLEELNSPDKILNEQIPTESINSSGKSRSKSKNKLGKNKIEDDDKSLEVIPGSLVEELMPIESTDSTEEISFDKSIGRSNRKAKLSAKKKIETSRLLLEEIVPLKSNDGALEVVPSIDELDVSLISTESIDTLEGSFDKLKERSNRKAKLSAKKKIETSNLILEEAISQKSDSEETGLEKVIPTISNSQDVEVIPGESIEESFASTKSKNKKKGKKKVVEEENILKADDGDLEVTESIDAVVGLENKGVLLEEKIVGDELVKEELIPEMPLGEIIPEKELEENFMKARGRSKNRAGRNKHDSSSLNLEEIVAGEHLPEIVPVQQDEKAIDISEESIESKSKGRSRKKSKLAGKNKIESVDVISDESFEEEIPIKFLKELISQDEPLIPKSGQNVSELTVSLEKVVSQKTAEDKEEVVLDNLIDIIESKKGKSRNKSGKNKTESEVFPIKPLEDEPLISIDKSKVRSKNKVVELISPNTFNELLEEVIQTEINFKDELLIEESVDKSKGKNRSKTRNNNSLVIEDGVQVEDDLEVIPEKLLEELISEDKTEDSIDNLNDRSDNKKAKLSLELEDEDESFVVKSTRSRSKKNKIEAPCLLPKRSRSSPNNDTISSIDDRSGDLDDSSLIVDDKQVINEVDERMKDCSEALLPKDFCEDDGTLQESRISTDSDEDISLATIAKSLQGKDEKDEAEEPVLLESNDYVINYDIIKSKKKRRYKKSVLYNTKKIKQPVAGIIEQQNYCEICKKSFQRVESLNKHKMTLTHIAKLSEIEFLNKQNEVVVKEPEVVVEELSSPKLVEEELSSPVQDNLMNDMNNRKALSVEEALFFECCSLLKSSEATKNEIASDNLKLLNNQYSNKFSDISNDSNNLPAVPKLQEDGGGNLSAFLATVDKFISTPLVGNFSMGVKNLPNNNFSPISSDGMVQEYAIDGDDGGVNTKDFDDDLYNDDNLIVHSNLNSYSETGDSTPPLSLVNTDDEEEEEVREEQEEVSMGVFDEVSMSGPMSGAYRDIEGRETEIVLNGIGDSESEPLDFCDSNIIPPRSIESSPNSNKKIPTKGALKVFESLKVSIPTSEFNLQKVIDSCTNSKLVAFAEIALHREHSNQEEPAVEEVKEDEVVEEAKMAMDKELLDVITSDDNLVIDERPITPDIHPELLEEDEMKKKAIMSGSNKSGNVVLTFGNNLGFRIKKKKVNQKKVGGKKAVNNNKKVKKGKEVKSSVVKDVYDFDDSLESTDVEIGNLKSFVASKSPVKMDSSKVEIEENSVQPSDDDDFNYISDDMTDMSSMDSTEVEKTKLDSEGNPKRLIVGKIFKKNLKEKPEKPNLDELFDNLLSDVKETKEEIVETPAVVEEDKVVEVVAPKKNKKKNQRSKNIIEQELGMSFQQIKEIIGFATRKSQRKCTTGKQNVLAENWSSDEELELGLRRERSKKASKENIENKAVKGRTKNLVESKPLEEKPVINQETCVAQKVEDKDEKVNGDIIVEEKTPKLVNGTKKAPRRRPKVDESSSESECDEKLAKKVRKKRKSITKQDNNTQPIIEALPEIVEKLTSDMSVDKLAVGSKKRNKQNLTDLDAQTAAILSLPRRKRVSTDMLYYWSSSSDEDQYAGMIEVKPIRDDVNLTEHPIQHGWIVGDSHKKLVTLLAHAKGKKTEDCAVKEGSGRKNRNSL